MILPCAATVLVERDVERPMQTVLDLPMATYRRQQLRACQRPARDEIACLRSRFTVHRPFADHHAQRGQIRPGVPIPHLVEIVGDITLPHFVSAMGLVVGEVTPQFATPRWRDG